MTVRTAVKSVLERGLVLSGAASLFRRRHAGELLILAYHNIVPRGARAVGDTSLHLPQDVFARQLDQLCETHRVVSLMDAITPMVAQHESWDAGPPRIVITFDDAYCGAVTAGIEELRTRGLPATVFVTPAYLGGRAFWWDVLTPRDEAGLSVEVREHALTALAGKGEDVVAWAKQANMPLQTLPPHALCATDAELASAMTYAKLTLGSHTWSHPNLTRLTASELSHELEAPRQWLAAFGDRAVPVVSYPYGCADGVVWQAAQATGYDSGLMIEGGWVPKLMPQPYALSRLNIPAGVSTDGFVLRTAGLISA